MLLVFSSPKHVPKLKKIEKSTYCTLSEVDIVAGRVSAASTTARWSSRVDSAEHPESRSYLSENSKRYGSLTGP